MTERKIEALDFNGETVYIEVTEIAGEASAGDGFDADLENVDAQSELARAGERVRSTISALAGTVRAALEKADPAEWTLEINLGFKGRAGIPFVTEGEANGAVKVTAKWQRGA